MQLLTMEGRKSHLSGLLYVHYMAVENALHFGYFLCRTSTQSEQDLWKILWKYESGMHYSKTDDQVYGEVHTRHHAETSIKLVIMFESTDS